MLLACFVLSIILGAVSSLGIAHAAEPEKSTGGSKAADAKRPASEASAPREIGGQVREVVKSTDGLGGKEPVAKRITLVVNSKDKTVTAAPAAPAGAVSAAAATGTVAAGGAASAAAVPPKPSGAPRNPADGRLYLQPRPAYNSLTEGQFANAPQDLTWSYSGMTGPETWWRLRPEFNLCATGRRQSPIAIDDENTLRGPAEAIEFRYQPSGGLVLNNGQTIQVDVTGDNLMTVRGSSYKLVQFHFHHPSEERINGRSYAMVAHLVHRNSEGQVAIVAVLLEPGAVNRLIDRVWTYMPLDKGDAVRIPPGQIDLNELLPKDQRYYQYLGSLTTPPCTEGVLWLIIKQPATLSPAQLQLFGQLFPNNTRPVQPLHDRPVRNAQ